MPIAAPPMMGTRMDAPCRRGWRQVRGSGGGVLRRRASRRRRKAGGRRRRQPTILRGGHSIASTGNARSRLHHTRDQPTTQHTARCPHASSHTAHEAQNVAHGVVFVSKITLIV